MRLVLLSLILSSSVYATAAVKLSPLKPTVKKSELKIGLLAVRLVDVKSGKEVAKLSGELGDCKKCIRGASTGLIGIRIEGVTPESLNMVHKAESKKVKLTRCEQSEAAVHGGFTCEFTQNGQPYAMFLTFSAAGTAAVSQGAKEIVDSFYKDYLSGSMSSKNKKPEMAFSENFKGMIEKNAQVCKEKAGGDICGWQANGNAYLNSQEYDPKLDYKNSGIKVTEPETGKVNVKMNIYPSQKGSGEFYDRNITFIMIQEKGKWVADDIVYGDKSSRKTIQEEIDFYTQSKK